MFICRAQHKQSLSLASKSSSVTEPVTSHDCFSLQRAKWGDQLAQFCQLLSPRMPCCENQESNGATGNLRNQQVAKVWVEPGNWHKMNTWETKCREAWENTERFVISGKITRVARNNNIFMGNWYLLQLRMKTGFKKSIFLISCRCELRQYFCFISNFV